MERCHANLFDGFTHQSHLLLQDGIELIVQRLSDIITANVLMALAIGAGGAGGVAEASFSMSPFNIDDRTLFVISSDEAIVAIICYNV